MSEVELIKALSEKKKIGNSDIMLTLKGKWGKRNYRTLFGVKGEIVTDTVGENSLMCAFPVEELLNAVIKNLPKLTLKGVGENETNT